MAATGSVAGFAAASLIQASMSATAGMKPVESFWPTSARSAFTCLSFVASSTEPSFSCVNFASTF